MCKPKLAINQKYPQLFEYMSPMAETSPSNAVRCAASIPHIFNAQKHSGACGGQLAAWQDCSSSCALSFRNTHFLRGKSCRFARFVVVTVRCPPCMRDTLDTKTTGMTQRTDPKNELHTYTKTFCDFAPDFAPCSGAPAGLSGS